MWETNLTDHKEEVWERIMEVGREREPEEDGVDNDLNEYDVQTILATFDFFSGDRDVLKQVNRDLSLYEYRVFDFIATWIDGADRHDTSTNRAIQVLAHAYLDSDSVEEFIGTLRRVDYQVVEPDFSEVLE